MQAAKPLNFREADFIRQVNTYSRFPESMRTEFIAYWTEPDRSPNQKMRWEKEKTWDLGRRLSRWANNSKDFGKPAQVIQMKPEERTHINLPEEIIEFDEILKTWTINYGSWTLERLSKWYDTVKKYRLWNPSLTKKEMADWEIYYNGNQERIKGAIVQNTLDYYTTHRFTFGKMLEVREKLK